MCQVSFELSFLSFEEFHLGIFTKEVGLERYV